MKLYKHFTITGLCIVLAACGSSSSNDPIQIDSISPEYQGIWVATDKGLAVSVGNNSVKNFMFTSDYCFLQADETGVETSDIERFVNKKDNNTLYWFAGYGSTEMSALGFNLTKESSLPSSCINNLIALEGQQGFQRDPEQTFEIFSQIFEEYYMDFNLMNVDWLGMSQQYSTELSQSSSDIDLLIAMDSMIEPLKDPHTSISTPDGIVVSYNNKPVLHQRLTEEFALSQGLPFPIPAEVITNEQLGDLQEYVEQSLEYQKQLITDYAQNEQDITFKADNDVFWFVNNGIGYLHIGKMINYSADNENEDDLFNDTAEIAAIDAIMDEALNDLANVEGLIIDVRTNNGGHEYVSLAIASRFVDSETWVYNKQHGKTSPVEPVFIQPRGEAKYTGAIAVLVSASTVSAGETFAMSMASLDNTVLIGESTQGAFSDIMQWTLPNGFEIGLSSEFYFDINNNWLEGQGVPVDIPTTFFSIEERELEYDAAIEAAIDYFIQ